MAIAMIVQGNHSTVHRIVKQTERQARDPEAERGLHDGTKKSLLGDTARKGQDDDAVEAEWRQQ